MLLAPRLDGVTLQIGVTDMGRSRQFYDRLFGKTPAFVPSEDFQEYEPQPGFWLQITTAVQTPLTNRLRFGVPDLQHTRQMLHDGGVATSGEGEIANVVAWLNFVDPDGNALGAYQDLSKTVA